MDVLSDLLRRARAGDALVRRLVQRPPWSMTYLDPPPLTVFTTLGGPGTLSAAPTGAPSAAGRGTPAPAGPGGALTAAAAARPAGGPDVITATLAPGDIAIVTAPGPQTIADGPGTPPGYVIEGGRKHRAGPSAPRARTAPRTWGDGAPDATTMLRGVFELSGPVAARLLTMLPPVAVVPAGPRTAPVLALLTAETARDEPGQDAVLARLLDLLLVMALRAWLAEPSSAPPGWYKALSDPAVGAALAALHADPARRWTVAALAAEARLSRAAFAARFTRTVGEPPLTYLTAWRMTLAADRLRTTDDPVALVARETGYADAFAFSVAFKRAHGLPPASWRRRPAAAVLPAPPPD